MKKIFISQRMRGLKESEILLIRSNIQKVIKDNFGNVFEFIDSYKPELKHAGPIEALGTSLKMMAEADFVLVPRDATNLDYDKLKGVEFEYLIARSYNKHILFYTVREDMSVYTSGSLFAVDWE
jgi:hypothetical protein